MHIILFATYVNSLGLDKMHAVYLKLCSSKTAKKLTFINYKREVYALAHLNLSITHSLTAALDQLRVLASSISNDLGPRSTQHQQIGQRLLPLAAANFSVDDRRALPVSSGRSAGVGFY